MKFVEKIDGEAVRVWAPRPADCEGSGGEMSLSLPDGLGGVLQPVDVPNGDLSEFDGENSFKGWETDAPGVKTFRDTDIKKSGVASLRMEFRPGCGRVGAIKFVKLPVNSKLRLVLCVKTKGINEPRRLTTLVYNGRTKFHGGVFGRARQQLFKEEMDWTEVSIPLEVKDEPEAMIFFGTWTLEAGMAWLDGIRIERGAGGAPKRLSVGYDPRFAVPRTLSNPDFYPWYIERLAEVKAEFPDAKRWVLATAKDDGTPLAGDMRWKARVLAERAANGAVRVELEDM